MRVIGGELKGRRIPVPSNNWPVRPTTDFAREALFNILDNRIDYDSIAALDLFGGTGGHSFELASRGCRDVTYVDRHREAIEFVKTLTKEWKLPIQVVRSNVIDFISTTSRQWDYIFADPPYDLKGIEDFPLLLINSNILKPGGTIVLEHQSNKNFSQLAGFKEARHYGQTVFSFFG